MKITIDILEETLEEAIQHAKVSTKRAAVLEALNDFNRKCRMSQIRQYLGMSDGFWTRRELDKLRAMN